MADTDKIIIPIEIDTQGPKDLSAINAQIDQIESRVRNLKPSKVRGGGGTSRSPIQTGDESEGFGIFAGERTGETLPTKTRDRTSRQAIPSSDEFHRMRAQMQEMEKQQSEFYKFFVAVSGELGYNIPFIGAGLNVARRTVNPVKKMQGFSSAPFSTGTGTKNLKGYARLGSALTNVAKYIPVVGAVIALIDMVVNELPQIIKEELYGPGKIFDKRFKREIAKEVAATMERQEKSLIAQGFRTVITTTYRTARGAANVSNTATKVIRGDNLYNVDNDFMLRGGRP